MIYFAENLPGLCPSILKLNLTLKAKKNNFLSWIILPVTALLFFGLTELAARFPQFTEKWYSQGIYPFFARNLSAVSSKVPFSLDDLFYVLLIIGVVTVIILLISRKISFKRTLLLLLQVVAVSYILFYLFWGLNYYRTGLNERLGLAAQKPDSTKFIDELKTIIDATSRSVCSFDDFDKTEIDSLVEDSYKKLAPVLKINYPMGSRRAKEITFSGFFAKAGISGYFGPFFNKVHVNSNNLPIEYPFVLAHEKAHQFGVTGEAEANFYAWLVCTQSPSKQLRYSANLYILRFFLYEGVQLEEFPKIMAKLDDKVKADFVRIRKNWEKLRNEKVDKAASKVNDTYLKTNKVEKGIDDYNAVVKHVMDYSNDKAFRKKWNLKAY